MIEVKSTTDCSIPLFLKKITLEEKIKSIKEEVPFIKYIGLFIT